MRLLFFLSRATGLFLLFIVGTVEIRAQLVGVSPDGLSPSSQPSQFEVAAGYMHMHAEDVDLPDLNGFNVAGFYNVNRWLAFGADFSALFARDPALFGIANLDVSLGRYSLLLGTRVSTEPWRHVRLFGSALLGAAHDQYDVTSGHLSYSVELDAFAMTLGGGFDLLVSRRWSLGASADYAPTTFLTSDRDRWQDNWRAGVHVSVRF